MALLPLPGMAAGLYQTDICMYGGTSGGVDAAVQAVRMGKSVVVVEPSRFLGGLTTGGLGATDTGNAAGIGGLSSEFYTRIGQKYGQAGRRFTFEPKVAAAVFQDLLTEHGISVVRQAQLTAVQKTGTRITEITTDTGDRFRASIFLDTTYEGDLMAQAGVSFTTGREANAQYGETLNGVRAGAQGHQFLLDVDPYQVPGNPTSGLLPYISAEPLAALGSADNKLQAYNFRLCLTQNQANFIPIAAPLGYDAGKYELLGRYIQARVNAGHALTLGSFLKIDAMPNGKTDINNQGAFSTDFIGQNYDYPNASPAVRAAIWEATRHYIHGLLHFLATDARVPQTVRNEMLSWGLCADEFLETGGWPQALYVREARRMVSSYVMTQLHAQGATQAPKPIGLGSYTMDSHNVQRIVNASGFVRNEGDVQTGVPQPYGIAYASIVPAAAQCENLFVTFCLSATHIAFGSARMEPVFMITSQSAATAAAIAINDAVPVQEVSYDKLSALLRADGQLLTWATSGGVDPANGYVADNLNATFTGAWTTSTANTGYYGTNYHHDGNAAKGTKTATFTPTLPTAGKYQVYLRWTENANRASNVPITIHHSTGSFATTVNQRTAGSAWNLLGTFSFSPGGPGSLVMETTATDGFVLADAALWLPVASVPSMPTVDVYTANASIAEGKSPHARLVFSRNGSLANPLTIPYTVIGTAAPGLDFPALAGSITIPAAASEAVLSIPATMDSLAEGPEAFTLMISPDAAYLLGNSPAASVTIQDDPYDAWRKEHFSTTQLADPTVSGEDADPDQDKLTNLLEFLSQTSPLAGNGHTNLSLRIRGNELYLDMLRHEKASQMYLQPQSTTNLQAWNPVTTQPTIQLESPFQRLSWRVREPLLPGFEGFRILASRFPLPTGEPGLLFYSFDALANGTGAYTTTPTHLRGFLGTPALLQSGSIFLTGGGGGAASYTGPDGTVWLGSGNSALPGHSLGWNPGSVGNKLRLTLNTIGQRDLTLRMDIRSAAAAGGTPPTGFTSFTYDVGTGLQAVPNATLTFPADNVFHAWQADLSLLDAIENQQTVTLEWTIEDLSNTPAPIESFRIDNLLLGATPVP